ncbi:MAG: response regulator [Gemmatimonadaceae bacterium]
MNSIRLPNREPEAQGPAPLGTDPLVVLLIDDEAKIRAAVRDALSSDHVEVIDAESGAAGLAKAEARRPDLVVVDLGLPDMEGVEIVRALRRWSTAPVIVLTARHAEDEKVALLDAGADDYVTKPFSLAELRARVRAQLRRARMQRVPGGDAPVRVGDGELEIDLARRAVMRRPTGEAIHLTPTEWSLLEVLVRHADRPVTHRQLYHAVWGNTYGDTAHYLRVYVAHLRRKLERDPYEPRFIITEPGVGYRLTLDAGDARDDAR